MRTTTLALLFVLFLTLQSCTSNLFVSGMLNDSIKAPGVSISPSRIDIDINSADITLNDNGRRIFIKGEVKTLTINGYDNMIDIIGKAGFVVFKGNANTVLLAQNKETSVDDKGNNNQLHYRQFKPLER